MLEALSGWVGELFMFELAFAVDPFGVCMYRLGNDWERETETGSEHRREADE